MGSTVSTRKLAAAFTSTSGTPCYVLFEETYSKNCHPHIPAWSCVAMGSVATVMQFIFLAASSCEGGMLKGVGGRDITPEGYLAGWMKEMASPVMFSDRTIKLDAVSRYNPSIPSGQLAGALAKLVALGRHDIATELEQGKTFDLSLHDDCELLLDLYDCKLMHPWRIITPNAVALSSTINHALAYAPVKAKLYDVSTPRFYKVNEKEPHRLMQGADGSWTYVGWDYSCVAEYVSDLWKNELREPGTYRARIKSYREALHTAPCLPAHGCKIVVDTTVAIDDYQQASVDRATAQIEHERVGSEIHMSVPTDFEKLYSVTALPFKCTKWVITDIAPTEQLSLLAG
jgi:hypothetical protein